MLTTGIFTATRFDITVDKLNEPIYLIPVGDVHRSSPMHSTEHWLEFLDWAKSKKRCYFLGMGDYDDLGSTSERRILLSTELHESSVKTLEKLYDRHVTTLVKELKFMDGKLIGLLEGNHYGQYADATTTTQRMCRELGTKYLGVSAFIKLVFHYSSRSTALDIWAHHGKGAARLVGGSLNRVQQMAEAADAQIFLMGHDHKKSVGFSSKLYLSDGSGQLKVRHRKQLYVRTGSFLKGYEEGQASYVADGAMNPTDLGVVKIELTPRRDTTNRDGKRTNDEFYIDLHASV